MNMIEKVARAIDSYYPHGIKCSIPNCQACADTNKKTEDRAKAAIEAMREPSEEMSKAGDRIIFECSDPEAIYRAMIDTVLKE